MDNGADILEAALEVGRKAALIEIQRHAKERKAKRIAHAPSVKVALQQLQDLPEWLERQGKPRSAKAIRTLVEHIEARGA